ncbi:AAA family ATPase [Glycomyces arizonensis]|uniref:AAA family ATPase n=1 Tax=Glycomyces arizonensis TaxID=256035 RepID=UPI000416DC5F|nr:ATP-binding protein [Glycomyces arizonensis]
MMMLSFTVRNHLSIRDELVLDLTKPSLRTLLPPQGTRWEDHVYTLAGIFGANASGKSAVLDAIAYAFDAIQSSATTWQGFPNLPRLPFLLDDRSKDEPSGYEIEFVHAERRYAYGFEVDAEGVRAEWLRDVPSKRWRTLLQRDREAGMLKTHPTLRAIGQVTNRELVLSRAVLLEHPQLAEIARGLVGRFDQMTVKPGHREQRLRSITEFLADGSIDFDDIVTLLQAADIGVEHVDIREDSYPSDFQDLLKDIKALTRARADKDTQEKEDDPPPVRVAIGPEESDAVVRNLLFTHRGTGADRPPFMIGSESDGTVAWLALSVPAIEMLRCGGLYCVDEIDSSLHPHLIEALLRIFDDPALNTKGAQLVFISHDSYILSPLSEVRLEPEQVWFTDKSNEGATELSCLSDFPRHKDANVSKRYLIGRYGGTPRLAPSAIGRLLTRKASG